MALPKPSPKPRGVDAPPVSASVDGDAPKGPSKGKPVEQIDVNTGAVVAVWPSGAAAGRKLGRQHRQRAVERVAGYAGLVGGADENLGQWEPGDAQHVVERLGVPVEEPKLDHAAAVTGNGALEGPLVA